MFIFQFNNENYFYLCNLKGRKRVCPESLSDANHCAKSFDVCKPISCSRPLWETARVLCSELASLPAFHSDHGQRFPLRCPFSLHLGTVLELGALEARSSPHSPWEPWLHLLGPAHRRSPPRSPLAPPQSSPAVLRALLPVPRVEADAPLARALPPALDRESSPEGISPKCQRNLEFVRKRLGKGRFGF